MFWPEEIEVMFVRFVTKDFSQQKTSEITTKITSFLAQNVIKLSTTSQHLYTQKGGQQSKHACSLTVLSDERSHTVHAYCVNTLLEEVFKRLNTSLSRCSNT